MKDAPKIDLDKFDKQTIAYVNLKAFMATTAAFARMVLAVQPEREVAIGVFLEEFMARMDEWSDELVAAGATPEMVELFTGLAGSHADSFIGPGAASTSGGEATFWSWEIPPGRRPS